METAFNTEVYGTTGWPKFGTPMVGGKNAGAITELNTAFDAMVAVLKKYGKNATPYYLQQFNIDANKLHLVGTLIIDGKASV